MCESTRASVRILTTNICARLILFANINFVNLHSEIFTAIHCIISITQRHAVKNVLDLEIGFGRPCVKLMYSVCPSTVEITSPLCVCVVKIIPSFTIHLLGFCELSLSLFTPWVMLDPYDCRAFLQFIRNQHVSHCLPRVRKTVVGRGLSNARVNYLCTWLRANLHCVRRIREFA